MKGRVFDVQRFSVHDGPGIRTTVFLSGCPLRCAWCHNPESFAGDAGAWRTPESVLEDVLRDREYFATSGGGLTISGGEPLLQVDFVGELLRLAREQGVHTCVQTAGEVPRAHLEALVGLADLVQFDVKHLDPARHEALTGRRNERILANLEWLLAQGGAVEVRLPLVPGRNDEPGHLERVAAFLRERGVGTLQVLPYQRLYESKYERLGLPLRCAEVRPPTTAQLAEALARLSTPGLVARLEA